MRGQHAMSESPVPKGFMQEISFLIVSIDTKQKIKSNLPIRQVVVESNPLTSDQDFFWFLFEKRW